MMANMGGGQMMVLNPNRQESERYSCPSCSKSFVRKAHMLRHQQQHASQKPFNCMFCSKSFKRSDVLRAHSFRCRERGDAPVPEGQSKGRKRSSCQSCVKLRTRCDQETPCSRCVELGKECVRVPSQPGATTPAHSHVPRPKSRDAIPIHHLLNSPPDDDFVGRFPIRDVPFSGTADDEANSLIDAEDTSEASQWSEEPEMYDPYVGAPDTAFESFFDGLETLAFNNPMMRSDNLAPTSHPGALTSQAQALEPRAAEVRQALQVTAANFGNTYPECQYMLDLGPAIEQLTGTECDNLVTLFFENYHRHCPTVHRPTFSAMQCPLPLLLSILALGGMYAPYTDTVLRMRSLLDVIELHIYSLPGLRDEFNQSLDLSAAPDETILWNQFESFQGAYLIIVAQYFSGNLAAKRRARRQRFTRILDIARSFKLPTSQHPSCVSISDEQAFTSWLRCETYIRQMNIMLALDAAMAIFNNVPPRISFSELDLQLPCDPVYFEISSYAELLSRSMFPRPKLKLVDAFQSLFLAPSDLTAVYENNAFNCWDMLFLVHCLYTHVWRQTYANPLLRSSPTTLHAPSTIIEPLKTALQNWKTIWDDIRSSITREQLKDMGFETSADSYWTLTKLIVQRFEGKHRSTSHSALSSATPNSIAPGIGTNGFNMTIKGHPTTLEEGPTAPGQYAVPGSYVSVGMGNAVVSSYPVGATGTITAAANGYPASNVEMEATSSQQAGLGAVYMPIETDFDSQGQHLRRILRRER